MTPTVPSPLAPTVLPVDPLHPDPAVLARAAAQLARGGLVAFPTETVYGLGANGLDTEAVARIYAAKGRPAWNPVILHVPDTAHAQALTARWPEAAQRVADAFWPGPLTLVLPRAAHVPDIVCAGLDAVGVRVPAHPVARALLQAAAVPVAAPSANRFTQVSPTTAAHVVASLGDRVPLVLDGGPCAVGIESTVLDLTGPTPTILRPGMITRPMLEAVLGVPVAEVSASVTTQEDAPAQRSPGMAERHYAPRADVWIYEAAQQAEIVAALAGRPSSAGDVVVLRLHTRLDDGMPPRPSRRDVPMPLDPADYARALYGALHEADAAGATLLCIERPPAEDAWQAVRDRLARAAR